MSEAGMLDAVIQRQASRIISSVLTIDEMLEELIGITVEHTGCDACLIYLLEPETGDLVLRASQRTHDKQIGTLRLKVGEGVTGWVAEHREAAVIDQGAWLDPRFRGFSDLEEDTYEAFLSAPMISGGELVGVINVHHQYAREHEAREISLMSFIGELIGCAIAKAQLSDEVRELRARLETSKKAIA